MQRVMLKAHYSVFSNGCSFHPFMSSVVSPNPTPCGLYHHLHMFRKGAGRRQGGTVLGISQEAALHAWLSNSTSFAHSDSLFSGNHGHVFWATTAMFMLHELVSSRLAGAGHIHHLNEPIGISLLGIWNVNEGKRPEDET